MTDIAVSKPLPKTAGLRSTNWLAKHNSADWAPNNRAVAVWSAGKRLHAWSVTLHAATEGDV